MPLFSRSTVLEVSLPDNDLKPLTSFRTVNIIGLARPPNGTKEFFQMKHRIFKYMVEKHGFKAIAFEMDVADHDLRRSYPGQNKWGYWIGYEGKMYFWTWKTDEVRDFWFG